MTANRDAEDFENATKPSPVTDNMKAKTKSPKPVGSDLYTIGHHIADDVAYMKTVRKTRVRQTQLFRGHLQDDVCTWERDAKIV